jgi:hypothetical protein
MSIRGIEHFIYPELQQCLPNTRHLKEHTKRALKKAIIHSSEHKFSKISFSLFDFSSSLQGRWFSFKVGNG